MFRLPKNSKIVKGKTFGTKNNLVLNIYRWNRESKKNPSVDTYHLNKSKMGPMLLDAIMYIKNNVDPTLTFRRSCREGICSINIHRTTTTNTFSTTSSKCKCGVYIIFDVHNRI